MVAAMLHTSFAKYLKPWELRREREAERLRTLRKRDGDNCARCRRPMHFDLPAGHDQGAAIELMVPRAAGGSGAADNLRLCHRRCNSSGVDHTGEVTERMRRKNEAALFAKPRGRESQAA
jgi:5-methylcytosine-specific restriction endonuclease McrA